VSPHALLAALALAAACGEKVRSALPISAEPPPGATTVGETLCLAGVVREGALRRPAELEAELGHFFTLGVRQVRFGIDWAWVEREPGVYDLAWLELPLRTLQGAGVGSIALLGYGNTLYNGRSDGDRFYPPLDPAPFGAYAGAVARRLGHLVVAFEVWNEPNAGYRFFKPVEDPVRFAALVVVAAAEVKNACPTCPVLFGGVFWHHEIVQGGPDFIGAAFRAEPSLADLLDGVGVHPYSYYPPVAPPESRESPEVPLDEKVSQAVAAASGLAPWITEVGWPVHGSVDEAAQAADLVKTYALAAAAGSRATCWYDLQDGPNPQSFPPEDAFGLLRYDRRGPAYGVPKRAYWAMQAVSRLLGSLGFSRDRREELGLGPDDGALFFRDRAGVRAATVLWSARPAEARLPLHADGRPALYDMEGVPRPLALVGKHARVNLGPKPHILVE
jgi:hypothetical protein